MPNKKLPCEVVYLFVFVCLLPFCEKEMNLRGSRTLIKVITVEGKVLKVQQVWLSHQPLRCCLECMNNTCSKSLKLSFMVCYFRSNPFVSVSGKAFRVLCIIH